MSISIEFDTETLIALVGSKPVLWNKAFEGYKDRNKTKEAWNYVCHSLKDDFYELEEAKQYGVCKEIIKRWSNIRDAFVRYRRRSKEAKELHGTRLKKYVYEDQLEFFKKMQDEEDGCELDMEADEDDDDEVQEVDPKSESKWESRKRKLNEGTLHTILEREQVNQPQHSPGNLNEERKSLKITRKRKLDQGELHTILQLEQVRPPHQQPQQQQAQHSPDSHLSFFKGIIPALKIFNDDDIVKFQIGVLQLISDIRQRKKVN